MQNYRSNLVGNVDLRLFQNSWYHPGSKVKILCWMILSSLCFRHSLAIGSGFKVFLLRLFGAKIGNNVTIKPSIHIKYPWFLMIGNNSWLGEKVWIDNLSMVEIGSNCCISQGATLVTGNHNYSNKTFDLVIKPILIEDGVWICAGSTVCPGVVCHFNSVLTTGSIASKDLLENTINTGNPAVFMKMRKFNNS